MAGTLVDTNILQTAVSMGLDVLRENIVLAKLVNRDYEGELKGAKRGDVVKVAVPAAITTRTVTPDVVDPAVTAVTPTSVSVMVDQFKEAPFAMDDKAVVQIQDGIINMQLKEAAKSLANTIDGYLWDRITAAAGVYGYAGTAGTTPFGTDLGEFLEARKIAADQLMPLDDRFCIVDSAAEANLLGLPQVTNASFRNSDRGFVKGELGEMLGATWAMSQNVDSHTATGTGTILVNDAGVEVGDATLTWDGGGTAPAVGDIFTVAGDTQTYQVQSSTATVITMLPTAQVAWADDAAVTVVSSYVKNLLLHRDLIAFAMAPLQDSVQTAARAARTAVAIDAESGLAMRLEISDQYKQTQWSFDALYGAAIPRPEYGVIIAG